MTILFLDEFNGSGTLAGRAPDVGASWSISDTYGVVTEGELRGAVAFSTRFFEGTATAPPKFGADYTSLTVRLGYQVYAAGDFSLTVEFRGGINGPLYRVGTTYDPQVQILDLPVPAAIPAAFSLGAHEFIATFDYVGGMLTCYLDGVEVFSAPIPPNDGEISYTPSPASSIEIYLSGSNEFGDEADRVRATRMEMTDQAYLPAVPAFWSNRVLCTEIF